MSELNNHKQNKTNKNIRASSHHISRQEMQKINMLFYISVLIYLNLVITNGQELCSQRCVATYPLHTVDKVTELQACTKGCRLQFISFLSGKTGNCQSDCSSAYGESQPEIEACLLGCKEQTGLDSKPFFPELEESDSGFTFHVRLLHPMFSVKRYCSDMFSNAAAYVRSSTYVFQRSATNPNENSIFMHLEMYPVREVAEVQQKYESNEEKIVQSESRSSSALKHYLHKMHRHASKWLSCVEGKAGVPYATLVGVLFLSLAMVGWICCSACDDHDDEDEEETETKKQTKHVFSKSGLSIQADAINHPAIFTIVKSKNNDQEEKLLIA